MIASMFNLMGMMFLLMLVGWLLRKREIITAEGKRMLTDLILYCVLPCNIVRAFMVETSAAFWAAFVQVLVIAAIGQGLALIGNRFLYRRVPDGERQVYQYATICSNAGFMGNPMAEGVFGDTGLLYASIFLIPLRIMMWTAGVSCFAADYDKKKLFRKVLTHPCMIAVYIGLILMVTQYTPPEVLMKTLTSISGCNTPMTMIYIGTILCGVHVKELITRRQLAFAFIRLILLPAVLMGICAALHVDHLVTGVCVLMTAMPAGSTTSLLASKYEADEASAAKCVVLTTILSIATTFAWSMLLTA